MRTLLALLLVLAPPLMAQDTTAIKKHVGEIVAGTARIDQDVDTIRKDRGRPGYVKRADVRIDSTHNVRIQRAADSILAAMRRSGPVPPKPDTIVVPTVASVTIAPATATVTVGASVQLTATPKAANGVVLPSPIRWGATPTALCDVSGTGLLTGKGAGNCTVTATADPVVGSQVYPVKDVVIPVPPPTDSTSLPPVAGKATLAELPRASVNVTYPLGYTIVNVPASAGALQTALNTSACRVELRLVPNFQYAPVQLPAKPCTEQYHTIVRTNNGLPLLARGVRVTPSLSVQRQQAKIASVDAGNAPAVSADGGGVHGYYFEDVAILGGGTQDVNALVKLGINQTTMAQVPGDFVFSHTLVSGTPTLRLKRNFYINSARTAVVDSWCAEGHDNNGDSQCWLGLNGPGPYLIENNYMEASHEVVMFGGGDPSIPGLVPSDITIRHNHITRPASWKGVWTAKNLIECKNARRMLVEGNVIENIWADGQVGYAILCKSVNQDGTAPQSQATDITFRYNLVQNAGAGWNFCAACQNQVVNASRITVYDNITKNVNTGIFRGEGRLWQFLGPLSHVSVTHNTTILASGVETSISFDGQPPKIVNMDFRSNAYDNGEYGVHGGSGGSDWRLFVDSATSNWTHNVAYPPGKWAEAGFNAQGYYSGTAPTHDGRPLGANASLVYAKIQGAVVSDPTRAGVRRAIATPRQSGYRPASLETRCRNTYEGNAAAVTRCIAGSR
jgi:hypothetical protein